MIRWNVTVSWIAKALIFLLIPYTLAVKDFEIFGLVIASSIVILLPNIIEKKYDIYLPWYFDFILVFIIYINTFGNIFRIYGNVPGFDKFTHFFFSALFSFLAFMIVVNLYYFKRIRTSAGFAALLILVFGFSLGSFWEIIEFASDKLLGTHAQYGLNDTMWDIIFDFFGSAIVASIGYNYFKKNKTKDFNKKFIIKSRK